jgi:hypothetical protein
MWGDKAMVQEHKLNYELKSFNLLLTAVGDYGVTFALTAENGDVFTNELGLGTIKQLGIFCKSQNLDHFFRIFDRISKAGDIKLGQTDNGYTLNLKEISDGYVIISKISLKATNVKPNDNTTDSGIQVFAEKYKEEVRVLGEELREANTQILSLKTELNQVKKFVKYTEESEEEEEGIIKLTVVKPRECDAPKRSISAFFFYQKERRPVLKLEQPDLDNKTLISRMAEEWGNLAVPLRSKYMKMADEDKERYELEKKEYDKANHTQTN